MSDLTVIQARDLILKPRRRRPTAAFIASRQCNRRERIEAGRRIENALDLWNEFLPMEGGAAHFNVVLDTTAPGSASLSLNGGAPYATARPITATLSTSDSPTTGYQILIWGSVDTSVNASIQATQGASAWITPASFPAAQAVTLSTGDGVKTINARIRDDVWNETSTLTQTITLDTTIPVVTIQSGRQWR